MVVMVVMPLVAGGGRPVQVIIRLALQLLPIVGII
jgi:hypothetical protein